MTDAETRITMLLAVILANITDGFQQFLWSALIAVCLVIIALSYYDKLERSR